jgi:hypothetical protein
MGVDLGGPAEGDPAAIEGAREHATAVAIGRVALAGVLPVVQVVRHRQWLGRPHWDGYEELCALAARWRVQRLFCDATGLGGPIAEGLVRRLGPDRVAPFVFTGKCKSDLGYDLLAWINSGRLNHYREDPEDILYMTFFGQARDARRQLRRGAQMGWGVPPPGTTTCSSPPPSAPAPPSRHPRRGPARPSARPPRSTSRGGATREPPHPLAALQELAQ